MNQQLVQVKFKAALQSQWKQLKQLLPDGMDPGRFVAVAMLALQKKPELTSCSPTSFALAVMNAAELGLDLGTEAYLVSYGSIVHCQPGYQGMAKLALQAGFITEIWADVIREGDEYEIIRGTEKRLHHVRKAPLGAPLVAAYCCTRDRAGNVDFTVLDKDQIEKRRDWAPKRKSSPWDHWPEEMAMAKAVRARCKLLPKSSVLSQALLLHDHVDVEPQKQAPMIDLDAFNLEDTDVGIQDGTEPEAVRSDAGSASVNPETGKRKPMDLQGGNPGE